MWGINQYQQVPPAPRPTQFRGTWVMANSYQEAQGIPVPMDGTPILVMLNDEQKFYLVSMQNGQRMISAFSFNALTVPNNETAQNVPNNDLEARLSRIEEMIGGLLNEPNNKNVTATTATKRKQAVNN